MKKGLIFLWFYKKKKNHLPNEKQKSLNQINNDFSFYLTVSPTILVKNRSIFTPIGQKVTLECISESHPNSVNYWIRGKSGDIVQGKFYILFCYILKKFSEFYNLIKIINHFSI